MQQHLAQPPLMRIPGEHTQCALLRTCGGDQVVSKRWQYRLLNVQSISMTTVVTEHGVCGGICIAANR